MVHSLEVKPLTELDRALFVALYTSAAVMKNIRTPLTKAQAEQYFEHILRRSGEISPPFFFWSIWVEQRPVGIVALMLADTAPNAAEIGIMLKPWIRTGRVSDFVMQKALKYAFDRLGLESVYAHTARSNIAAQKLLDRLGFEPAGLNNDNEAQITRSILKQAWTTEVSAIVE